MTAPETTELDVVDRVLAGEAVPPGHDDLAALALLLRDERPAPPDWTSLDAAVGAGFPRPPARRPPALRARLRALARPVVPAAGLVAACGVAVVLVIGGAGDSDNSVSGGATVMREEALDAGAPSAEDAAGGVTDGGGGGEEIARRVERTAALTLGAPAGELDRVADGVADVATRLGGFVAYSSLTSGEGGALELRVPSERVETAIERIGELGAMRGLSRETLDITGVVVSARDRLADARAERTSLLRRLEKADSDAAARRLRARLRRVSREIAAARGAVANAERRARYATVSVALVRDRPEDEGGAGGAWTPGDALGDALRVLEVAAGVLVVAAAVLLPLALVWVLAGLTWRALARRRRERALDMA